MLHKMAAYIIHKVKTIFGILRGSGCSDHLSPVGVAAEPSSFKKNK